MIKEFVNLVSDVKNIIVYIGPAIGDCCYEVSRTKDNRVEGFEKLSKNFVRKEGDKVFLNLKEVVKFQLIEAGVGQNNLEISDICTCCNKEFPSYYRDGEIVGDLLTVIGYLVS